MLDRIPLACAFAPFSRLSQGEGETARCCLRLALTHVERW